MTFLIYFLLKSEGSQVRRIRVRDSVLYRGFLGLVDLRTCEPSDLGSDRPGCLMFISQLDWQPVLVPLCTSAMLGQAAPN